MFSELEDNRRRIVAYTSREPRHFCYTSGFYLPEYPAYLKEYGILSATTCFQGLCSATTDPLLLPRFGDGMAVPDVEFRAWLAGTAGLLPHRRPRVGQNTLLESSDLVSAKSPGALEGSSGPPEATRPAATLGR